MDLNITVTTKTATLATFVIDRTNYLLYQSQEVAIYTHTTPDPSLCKYSVPMWYVIVILFQQIEAANHLQLQVSARGRGFALFQVQCLL